MSGGKAIFPFTCSSDVLFQDGKTSGKRLHLFTDMCLADMLIVVPPIFGAVANSMRFPEASLQYFEDGPSDKGKLLKSHGYNTVA